MGLLINTMSPMPLTKLRQYNGASGFKYLGTALYKPPCASPFSPVGKKKFHGRSTGSTPATLEE